MLFRCNLGRKLTENYRRLNENGCNVLSSKLS